MFLFFKIHLPGLSLAAPPPCQRSFQHAAFAPSFLFSGLMIPFFFGFIPFPPSGESEMFPSCQFLPTTGSRLAHHQGLSPQVRDNSFFLSLLLVSPLLFF